eukprot:2385999-Amphidinium_carterae.1
MEECSKQQHESFDQTCHKDPKHCSIFFCSCLSRADDCSCKDYIRSGVWQNETMKMDIEILECHRAEAGAPAPRPMEEVPMPKVPPGAFALHMPASPQKVQPTAPSITRQADKRPQAVCLQKTGQHNYKEPSQLPAQSAICVRIMT